MLWRLSGIGTAMAAMAAAAGLLAGAAWAAQDAAPGGEKPPAKSQDAHGKKVDHRINAQFEKADIRDYIKRFESNDREVYARRMEIVESLGLRPGMAVADVGAGTGLFTRLMADAVGPTGKVYAVDVSKNFLGYIAARAKQDGQEQVVAVEGTQTSTNLKPGSVDLVFLCDVYHHLEDHEKVLASIRGALRQGGRLVLIEFDRVEGRSSKFVLDHIRADQATFRREIEAAGFGPVPDYKPPQMKENFVAVFAKR
ncbi:Demethylmenaquinone methyltransferase [Aquisphaera giovannonii]|uniref:Demethylmenaquinone methyltransferase n=1 Tax=Aquisphaera giovannonii TaxID=406548 RepID=A0A5B9W3E6_9BACT|nr:methyltransferase domain-containing protein [Aquisphaera giovannonii]QEH34764.1 Demethylmenaquinone methyltransferase [Aquisphaera giovannonii]